MNDDVANKLKPGRELEGGANCLAKTPFIGEVGETCRSSKLHARLSPENSPPCVLIVLHALFPAMPRKSIRWHHLRIYVVCVIIISSFSVQAVSPGSTRRNWQA
jgi:hypothetical protein